MCSSDFSSWGCMNYCFDIDGTIFETPLDKFGKPDYKNFFFQIHEVPIFLVNFAKGECE